MRPASRKATQQALAPCRRNAPQALLIAGLALITAAAVGCHSYPPPTPLDQLNPEQAAGHAVYQTRCAQCHYDRVDQGKNGPSLVAIFKKPSLHSGAAATDERVTNTVLHGHGLMPALGDRVDDEQMQQLLAYLHTL